MPSGFGAQIYINKHWRNCTKMALNLTRLLALFCVFCVLVTTAGTLDIDSVKAWAASVGSDLNDFFMKATQYKKLQEGYRSSQLSLSRKDGIAIANQMKKSLEDVLQEKIESIKNLAAKTEELRNNYTLDLAIQGPDYYDTKNLEGLPLEIDPRFSAKVKINKSSSVVHIPTDVYKGGKLIRNTIKWTEGLDKYFKENEEKDPTLLWQYFGSADGVYRVYPGFKWGDDSTNDIFDNRRRGWYIQGSSSPKDIVLILDLSGSMAGQKLSILKLSALSLLDTLQENDFVNIVAVYDAKPVMVCQLQENGTTKSRGGDCTMDLLQATAQNKKFLQHFIPNNAFAKGIAKASLGFDFAIDVLQESRAKRNFTSSDCTQAVILFTDGIEKSQSESSREVLEKKNKDKTIRVFTYLVGSDKRGEKPLREISIDYRGCFYEIQTHSDVREKVLKYVSVLSRPLGFVPGGADPSWTPIYLDKLGLGLMITLVVPVFNGTANKGELLGVVGTDMPLPQLEGTVPGSEVGVNGYGFAINNNGFVLFHPGLNKEKDPPNIALDEVEYNGKKAQELTRNMIDRLTGSLNFTNRLLSEDKHKLSWDSNYHYFFSPVINTSFSAAVAIPEIGLYSLNAPDFKYEDKDVKDFLSNVNNEDVIVAPWKICPGTPVAAESTTPVYQPAYANATDIISDKDRKKNCDVNKLRNLLFDANITKEAAAKNWDANENQKNQIHNVFVGTHGGIMRLLNTDESTLLLKERDYIKEQFYTEAAQYANKGEDIIVFSAPYRSPGDQPAINESAVITASCPIVKVQGGHKVVAAVAGMQFDQKKINEIFLAVSSQNECNSTDDCFCRLIDDDGFILATNQPDDAEVGKFFGVSEGAVLNEFINQSMFNKFTFTNVQGECNKPEQDSSSARTLLNPLFAVTSYVQFWTQTVFWSLMQFNIYSFFSRGNVALAEEEQEVKIPCSQELQFYKGVWQSQTYGESLECPESGCTWRPYMAAVDNTNLRLVVIKRSCSCIENEITKITTKPQDSIPEIPIPSVISYRKPPELKSPCDDKNEQGKPPCALASLSSPQYVTVLVLFILTLLINNHWR